MSSFKGTYQYSIDSKGRINIPAKLRKYVSLESKDTFVVTRGYDQCLFIYPLDEWNGQEALIRNLIQSDPRHRFFMRTLLQYATETELDGQSRVMIPRELLEFARIQGAVTMIGMLDHIEVWNPEVYDEYLKIQTETYERVAQEVFKK